MAEHNLGSEARPARIAVVGSGPSAFYAVEAWFKAPGIHVRADVFDRLPTPFGLVRGGVAPDHQKIKSVVRVYEKVAADPGFRFFGNVMLGRDLEVEDLRAHYDQIIYAVGNEADRELGIPGQELDGVHSATSFVGWYNGHPDFRALQFGLERAERAAVVGNGNVAMDVARVLMRDAEELARTDMPDYAVEALRKSRVCEVLLLGRRGPAQAAFSPKEIAELAEVDGCDLVVDPVDVELDEVSARWLESAPRSAQRNVSFLREQCQRGEGEARRKVRCRFCVSPVELIGDGGRLAAVRIQHNELHADADGTPRPRGTERYDTEPVQLLFAAIGYRGVPIRGVPFDERRGIIPNRDGRVVDPDRGEVVPREYVVGWAKRGPTGLIGSNSPDSKATVAAMLEDLAVLRDRALPADDDERLPRLLAEKGVRVVTYQDWQRLDQYELERGQERGKDRHKLTSIEEMLALLRELPVDR